MFVVGSLWVLQILAVCGGLVVSCLVLVFWVVWAGFRSCGYLFGFGIVV